jgi:hypothetical protein
MPTISMMPTLTCERACSGNEIGLARDGLSHPRTQGLFGKDPGIVWSHDSTKINCPRGSGKVSNYMLENVTVLKFQIPGVGFYDT